MHIFNNKLKEKTEVVVGMAVLALFFENRQNGHPNYYYFWMDHFMENQKKNITLDIIMGSFTKRSEVERRAPDCGLIFILWN